MNIRSTCRSAILLTLTVCVATLGIRVAGTWLFGSQLELDPDAYRQIADNLGQHQVLGLDGKERVVPTAFRPPLYPIVLCLISGGGPVSNRTIATINVLLGVATAVLIFRISERQFTLWGLRRELAIAPALLFAADPIAVNQSALAMTESLACFMAASCLAALQHLRQPGSGWKQLAVGICFGVAILCRPTFLAWAGLIGLHQLLTKRRLTQLATFVAGIVVALLPWIMRNQVVLGKPIFATTHGGYTLLLGNNRLFYEHLQTNGWRDVWDGTTFDQGWLRRHITNDPSFDLWQKNVLATEPSEAKRFRRNEWQDDQFAYQVAAHHISQQPSAFLQSSIVKLCRLWSPLPHRVSNDTRTHDLRRYIVGVWYAIAYVFAIVGVVRHRWLFRYDFVVWSVLLCISLSVIHTFYWSNMRMRAPAMIVVYLIATLAVVRRNRT